MQIAEPECSPQNSWKSWVSESLTAELGVGIPGTDWLVRLLNLETQYSVRGEAEEGIQENTMCMPLYVLTYIHAERHRLSNGFK